MKYSYDIVIIGSGITGLSLAYWLRQLSELKILVLDKSKNYAATSKSAGFLTSGSLDFFMQLKAKFGEDKAKRIWKISKDNFKQISLFINQNKLNVNYVKGGSFTLSDHKFETVPMSFIEGQKILGLNSYFDSEEASVSPDLLRKEMIELLKGKGVKFNFNHSDCDIDSVYKMFNCRYVFVATNTSELIEENFKIDRVRAQASAFHVKTDLPVANFYIPSKKIYFKNTTKSLVVGGLRLLDEETENTDVEGLNTTIQNGLENFVKENIDAYAVKLNSWSGIMGFSPTHLPICRMNDKYAFIGGHSGHGNGFAFILSKYMAEKFLMKKSDKSWEIDFF